MLLPARSINDRPNAVASAAPLSVLPPMPLLLLLLLLVHSTRIFQQRRLSREAGRGRRMMEGGKGKAGRRAPVSSHIATQRAACRQRLPLTVDRLRPRPATSLSRSDTVPSVERLGTFTNLTLSRCCRQRSRSI